MPDFEFPNGGGKIRNPFNNKKLQPFLIAGVVLVVLYVLLTKRNTGSTAAGYSDTEYQQTYATNTGVTTQVNTMLEDYKEQVADMLTDNQSATDDKIATQNEQLLQYMDELNTMFDEKHASWDDEYDKNMDALQQHLEKMQGEQSAALEKMQKENASALAGLSGSISNLQTQLNNAQKQQTTSSKKTSSSSGSSYSPSLDYDSYNIKNGRESNVNFDGKGNDVITYGLLNYMGEMGSNGTSTSHYGADSNFYYEDAAGNVSSSTVKSMTQTTKDGKTTTTLQFNDGSTRVVQNIKNGR